MECKFSVGMKVVCVDDSDRDESVPGWTLRGGMDGLRKGAIYTIRSVFISPAWRSPVVRLEEIQRLPLSHYNGVAFESGYDPDRFRPVVTRKTDISIFTDMLTTTRVEERA